MYDGNNQHVVIFIDIKSVYIFTEYRKKLVEIKIIKLTTYQIYSSNL